MKASARNKYGRDVGWEEEGPYYLSPKSLRALFSFRTSAGLDRWSLWKKFRRLHGEEWFSEGFPSAKVAASNFKRWWLALGTEGRKSVEIEKSDVESSEEDQVRTYTCKRCHKPGFQEHELIGGYCSDCRRARSVLARAGRRSSPHIVEGQQVWKVHRRGQEGGLHFLPREMKLDRKSAMKSVNAIKAVRADWSSSVKKA